MAHAAVRIDRHFRLRLAPVEGQHVEVRLSRLGAQQLGQAMLQYSGAMVKAANRGPVTIVVSEHDGYEASRPAGGDVRLKK